jgi:hypothetical protein
VVELYDLLGRRLASAPVSRGAGELTLAGTRSLGSGVFFARITTAAGRSVAKLVATR